MKMLKKFIFVAVMIGGIIPAMSVYAMDGDKASYAPVMVRREPAGEPRTTAPKEEDQKEAEAVAVNEAEVAFAAVVLKEVVENCGYELTVDDEKRVIKALEDGADPKGEGLSTTEHYTNGVAVRMPCSALHIAALRECVPLMRLLLAYKADVNATDGRGVTPLFFAIDTVKKSKNAAALEREHDMVALLLAHDADVNAYASWKDSFLSYAVDFPNASLDASLAKTLVDKGANLRIIRNGNSLLEIAIQKGAGGVACALLSKGIAANETVADGGHQTGLSYFSGAVIRGNTAAHHQRYGHAARLTDYQQIATMLVLAGVDVHGRYAPRYNEDKTVFDCAESEMRETIVQALHVDDELKRFDRLLPALVLSVLFNYVPNVDLVDIITDYATIDCEADAFLQELVDKKVAQSKMCAKEAKTATAVVAQLGSILNMDVVGVVIDYVGTDSANNEFLQGLLDECVANGAGYAKAVKVILLGTLTKGLAKKLRGEFA